MALYAIDDLDDALAATRAFLLPFDAGRWLRLALVALFVAGGSGSGAGTPPWSASWELPAGEPAPGPSPADVADALEGVLPLLVLLTGIGLVVGLAFALVAAVMEFVLVEALRSEAVAVRRDARRHWGRGLRLFGFRLVVALVGLAIGTALVAIALGPLLVGAEAVSLIGIALAAPALLLLVLLGALVNGFTTAFVVPVMIAEDRGVVSAWRRLWPTLVDQWRQYLAFAVVALLLNLLFGVALGILLAVPAAVLFVPVGVLVGLAVAADAGVLALVVGVTLAVGAGLALLAVAAFVQVPVQTYLRYHALFVLGDTNRAFDLIPERRGAVRES